MNKANSEVQFLQYIWVEKYMCLEDFETNFTNRVIFHYDKNKRMIISVKENENYVNDYLSENMSLSCIVGRNGTGKTTILRLIKEILGGVNRNCIVITYNGHDYDCWHYLSINDTDNRALSSNYKFSTFLNLADQVKKEIQRRGTPQKYKSILNPICRFPMQSTRVIFCSNSYSQIYYHHSTGTDDLVPPSMIFDNKDPDNGVIKDPLNSFYLNQFNLQLNLITELETNIEEFSIRFPPYVKADLIYEEEQYNIWFEEYTKKIEPQIKKEYKLLFNNFIAHRNDSLMNTFMDHIGEAIFYNMIYEISHTFPKITAAEFNSFIEHIKECNENSAYENLIRFLVDNPFWESESNKMLFLNRQKYLDFLLYFKELTKINYDDTSPLYFPILSGNASFIIPVNKDIPSKDAFFPKAYIHTDIKDFFLHYKEIASLQSFIHFSWGLSDGEQALLDLYSRLFSLSKRKTTTDKFQLIKSTNNDEPEKNAILLLDEIDNSLHPDWQRKIINSLISFVHEIYQGTNLQIIITSHSPIILSDIPKQNTVFLQIEGASHKTVTVESNETFAANIYSLYKNSFFFDESMIGAFAEKKLKELAKEIQAATESSTSIENRINMIGDIYIRRQFWEIYHKNTGTESEEQILQKRIRELELELASYKGNTTNQEGDFD